MLKLDYESLGPNFTSRVFEIEAVMLYHPSGTSMGASR